MAPKSIPIDTRLARRTNVNGPMPASHPEWGQCWVWTGGLRGNGYAAIGGGGHGAPNLLVHRVAWSLADGLMPPDDMVIGHTCDTRVCVRNDSRGTYTVNGVEYPRWGHLFLCPKTANYNDMLQKGRQAIGALNGSYTQPERRPRGEGHGCAKLTESDVIQIRALYQPGLGSVLARQFGVRQVTISRIVRGDIWKHLL